MGPEKCKAILEASFKKLDLPVARRFALKAKQLFPELDGLAQFTPILYVYIAAYEELQNGEANWYAILQVGFQADENTIRKQYRKLALFLHPDKNKSFGAEVAFKYISQAWSVLSDGKKNRIMIRGGMHIWLCNVHARSIPPTSLKLFKPGKTFANSTCMVHCKLNRMCSKVDRSDKHNQGYLKFMTGRVRGRIQRATASLQSLQPLQAATSQVSFVSRLSMGSQQPIMVLHGHFFSALSEL
ncbi:hypothetical protein L7F22_024546 [Adiantum nelumboides]|nr:hypothetical protein [Adiantum nelumboides]